MQIFSVIFTLWPNFWVLTRNDECHMGALDEARGGTENMICY